MKMLHHARAWAERGFAVLPLTPRDKSPLGHLAPNGAYSATRDLAVIRRWWKAEPEANIGVAADHGLILLDIDPRHGGHLSLAELEIENGDLPATLWEWSGGVCHCDVLAADVRGSTSGSRCPIASTVNPLVVNSEAIPVSMPDATASMSPWRHPSILPARAMSWACRCPPKSPSFPIGC